MLFRSGIWGGYDDNAIEKGSTNYPKVVWKAIMSRIHQGLEPKDFTMPSTIEQASVCKESGLLPLEGVCDLDQRGSTVYTEYFAKGTVPTEQCDHHILLNIDSSSGMIANAFCPADALQQKVYVLGGTPGTEENDFLATQEFLNQSCSVHNASTTTQTPITPTLPSGTGNNNPTTNGTTTTDPPKVPTTDTDSSSGTTGTTGTTGTH